MAQFCFNGNLTVQALISVLEANFEKFGRGAEKIRRNEFAIEDAATKQDIDLNTDWELCFQPGQRAEMSILFDRPIDEDTLCPRCLHKCRGKPDSQITWYVFRLSTHMVLTLIGSRKCRLSFRRITEFKELECVSEVSSQVEVCGPKPAPEAAGGLKRKRGPDGDEMAPFRKVRIRTLVPLRFSQEIRDSMDGPDSNRGSSLIDSAPDVSNPLELSTSVDSFVSFSSRKSAGPICFGRWLRFIRQVPSCLNIKLFVYL
jgi:hypothetical protein